MILPGCFKTFAADLPRI